REGPERGRRTSRKYEAERRRRYGQRPHETSADGCIPANELPIHRSDLWHLLRARPRIAATPRGSRRQESRARIADPFDAGGLLPPLEPLAQRRQALSQSALEAAIGGFVVAAVLETLRHERLLGQSLWVRVRVFVPDSATELLRSRVMSVFEIRRR